MTQPLLDIRNLKVRIGAGEHAIRAVDDVSFHINRGETFALLGESGCGKSMTALSILRLLPQPAGRITSGHITLDGTDLTALPEADMRGIRGRRIAMIFQEPMTSLNPVLSVGDQIGETLRAHHGLKGRAERDRVLELLDAVGIPDVKQRIDAYPHQLSGGMKQRVMIAMALACEPEILIADEPTTALDVTIQAQIVELVKRLRDELHEAVEREHGKADPAKIDMQPVAFTTLKNDPAPRILYVASDGNDANDCLSPTTTCATPTSAWPPRTSTTSTRTRGTTTTDTPTSARR